jgi:hypothetical protein
MAQNEQFDGVPALLQSARAAEPPICDDCRAARIEEVTQFAECLVTASKACPHRMTFSSYLYCLHPQRKVIIARTLADEGPPGKQGRASTR